MKKKFVQDIVRAVKAYRDDSGESPATACRMLLLARAPLAALTCSAAVAEGKSLLKENPV